MSKGERRRTRISSTIDKLPDDIKTELDVRLADTANTYEDLSAWLKAEGYEISKSAIGRYAIRSTQAAQRVAETLQRTQAIAQAVEAHPDLDYTKAASMVLMDGLMQRVSTAEGDFQEMPLDKAGRLIASLARNATLPLGNGSVSPLQETMQAGGSAVLGSVTVLCGIWSMIWGWQAFCRATHAKGLRSIAVYAGCYVLAAILLAIILQTLRHGWHLNW